MQLFVLVPDFLATKTRHIKNQPNKNAKRATVAEALLFVMGTNPYYTPPFILIIKPVYMGEGK